MEAKTDELVDAATAELDDVLDRGGAFSSVEELKTRLVKSQAARVSRIESREQMVVGVNCFTDSAPSPLPADSMLKLEQVESGLRADVEAWRRGRDKAAARSAVDALRRAAEDPGADLMEPTLALAQAGGTTGEWGAALREVFGEFRGPTGVGGARGVHGSELSSAASRAKRLAAETGSPPRLLVGKPGLDGHSNGAEQIAVAARDAGFEVIYQGIRLTPEQIVSAARDEDVDVVGLSILSGSHLELVPEVLDRMAAAGVDAAVVVGGIIPPEDAEILLGKGVTAVYTPKDFEFGTIMDDLVGLVEKRRAGRH